MSVTIKDVAKIAGVSYATVSRALNGHPEINANTKQRIVQIAKEMGYSPNAIARGLVKKNTNMIGLLVPDIRNPYFPEVARGVEDFANSEGINVFLCNTNWEEKKEIIYIKALREKRVEGLIIAPVTAVSHQRIKEENLKIPVVYIGSKSEDDNENFVILDNFKAAFTATEYLIGLGHDNIAFVGGFESSISNTDRVRGYREALKKHNLEKEINLVKSSSFKRESGYAIALEFINEGRVPSGILAANDIIALGVIEAFENNGYTVPEDISVIGFDDISFASLPKINLTTIAQPKYQMGAAAAQMLVQMIGSSGNKEIMNHYIVEPELIIRGTCRKR
ncbi:MAG: LacI family DNA-binding transcriptional regulator [Bacillota bacterium]